MKTAINDICCVAGLAAITRAGWLVHPALAWLVAGAALFVYAIGRTMIANKEKKT